MSANIASGAGVRHRRGACTADQARVEARKLLGRAANGEDPAKEKQDAKKQITVAELCDVYLEQGVGTKKLSAV